MKKLWRLLGIAVLALGISTSFAWAENYNFSQNVYKSGMDHKDIQVIQEALKKDGSFNHKPTTTYFGKITKKAVETYQRKNDLKIDGIVGEGTLKKMSDQGLISNSLDEKYKLSQKLYKRGMTHKDIKIIQEVFEGNGVHDFVQFTTYFGPETEKAARAFQEKYNLTVDGMVGMSTINRMEELGLLYGPTLDTNKTVVSRGASAGKRVGQYLDWFDDIRGNLVKRQDILLIEDLKTRKRFDVKVTAGTNHADVEALTLEDTKVMKAIWGGFSWTRRAVLVYKDDYVIAASMTNMPHAGLESQPGGETVSNRSGGYGRGYNYDFVKNNGMDGHVDLHFNNSRRHKDNKEDPQHQREIKKAAGK